MKSMMKFAALVSALGFTMAPISAMADFDMPWDNTSNSSNNWNSGWNSDYYGPGPYGQPPASLQSAPAQ